MQKVLVVDDDVLIVDFVTMVLEMNDFVVYSTSSSKEAIRIIDEKIEELDLVFLDLMMPDINGWEILKYIRKKKDKIQLPVIIFTGNIKEKESLEINPLKDEINDFILKPVSYEELVKRVKEAINSRV